MRMTGWMWGQQEQPLERFVQKGVCTFLSHTSRKLDIWTSAFFERVGKKDERPLKKIKKKRTGVKKE